MKVKENLKEKVENLCNAYLDKVLKKINSEETTTDMVHEDIRIIHHIVKILNFEYKD